MSEKRTATDVDLTRETSIGTVAKFATLIVAFAGSIVFARVLGPAGYGGFYLLLSLVQVSEQLANGWATAGKKRFSEDITESLRGEIFGASLVGAVGVGVVGVVAAFFLSDRLASYVGSPQAPLLFAVLLFGMVLYTTLENITAGRGLVGVTNWGEALQTLFAFPLQLGFVLAGFGIAGMVYGYALGYVLVVPLFLYFIALRPVLPSETVVSDIVRFAKYSIPSGLFGRVYTRLDVILLGYLLSQSTAGYYEVAYRISIPASFVAAVAAPAVMSRTSELSSQNESIGEDVRNTLAYSAMLAIPIFFGALVLSEELVLTLYGSDYTEASLLLCGLALYRIVESQTTVLLNVIQGADRPDVTLKLSASTIAVNVVLGVVLVLEYGAIGVVVATIVAETLRYVGSVLVVRNWVEMRYLFPTQLGQQLLAAAVMFAFTWGLTEFVPIRSWISLAFVIAAGAAVYGGALLAVSGQHRKLVADVLSNFGITS